MIFIKTFIINFIIKYINNNTSFTNEDIEKIKYGVESLYLNISKIIIILVIALFLGIIYNCLLFLLLFNNLRLFGYGVHADKSSQCWISSIIFFVGIPYISNYIYFENVITLLIAAVCFILLYIYAPADTLRRPLINKKKIMMLKGALLFVVSLYLILIRIYENNIISNLLILSIVLETILVCPFTYKIFKVPYKNYLKYKGGDINE